MRSNCKAYENAITPSLLSADYTLFEVDINVDGIRRDNGGVLVRDGGFERSDEEENTTDKESPYSEESRKRSKKIPAEVAMVRDNSGCDEGGLQEIGMDFIK